jgi:methylphosphotriester-DNA--protein-cysteine methyltransferase
MKKFVSIFLSLAFIMMSCGVSFAECKNFVASKDSNRYHTVDCGMVKYIKPENKICFNTPEEAKKAGYAPCSLCNPNEKVKVVASKDSDKYHLPDCALVKNIKPENLVEYNSPSEAFQAGKRRPCEICKPPKPGYLKDKDEIIQEIERQIERKRVEPKADK